MRLHRPKWFTTSSTNRLHSSTLETSARTTITSGDPSSRALSATTRRRSSRLAIRAKRAPFLAYSYATCYSHKIDCKVILIAHVYINQISARLQRKMLMLL